MQSIVYCYAQRILQLFALKALALDIPVPIVMRIVFLSNYFWSVVNGPGVSLFYSIIVCPMWPALSIFVGK
jgi:hypothetical protein